MKKLCFLIPALFSLILIGCDNVPPNTSQSDSSKTTSSSCNHQYKTSKVDPTCTSAGYTLYTCEKCNDSYQGYNEEPLGHQMVHYEAKEVSCTTDGNFEYYHCTRCNLNFADEKGEEETSKTIIVANGHTMNLINAQEPSCTDEGNITYYRCTECKKLFSDIEGKNEITLEDTIVPASGHTLTKVDRVEPTLSIDGKEAHYQCEKCSLLFSDEKGEQQVQESDLRIKRGQVLTLSDAVSSSQLTGISEENGVITYDGAVAQGSNLIFGQQDHNDKQVFEYDINIDWKNEWSILTLWFNKWDNNTAFNLKIQPNKITLQKKYWDNGSQIEDLRTITDYKFNENQTIHVTMMMFGWTRTIMFDNYVVAHFVNDQYLVGHVAIETWDMNGYTLTNPVLRDYADDKLADDYPEVWFDYDHNANL